MNTVSIILFHGSGSGDFELESLEPIADSDNCRDQVRSLLRVRKDQQALQLLSRYSFELRPASNHFNDEFHVLHAFVSLKLYEEARQYDSSVANRSAFARIARAFTEV